MQDFKALEEKMQKNVNMLIDDLSKINVGRVSPTLLKPIVMIKENNAKVSLMEAGLVSVVNVNTLSITPWDEADIPLIEKTIKAANLGVNIGSMNGALHLIFPSLTQETRKELAKSINTYATNTKNALRSIRNDFMKANKCSTKEEEVKLEKNVQKIIDKFNAQVDTLLEKKQKEIVTG